MNYFKIGDTDYSMYVNKLKVNKESRYNSQTNAAGNTVVDYINAKRTIEVGIVPLDSAAMIALQKDIDAFNVSISFRNPITGALEENVNCIIPSNSVEYYTIQINKVMFNAFTLNIIEL
jgi:hypothetical protein